MITEEEILKSTVRALSWKQPYAQLMFHWKWETRTWNTNYRGLVLICSSAVNYADIEIKEISGAAQYYRILQALGVQWTHIVKRGNAIGIGRLVGCRPMEKEDGDRTFVQYSPDRWVHLYEDVHPIETFPWRGSQGWKTLDYETKKLIKII
jgi:hypothetical protein